LSRDEISGLHHRVGGTQPFRLLAEDELHAVAGAIAQKAPQHISQVAVDDDRLSDPRLV